MSDVDFERDERRHALIQAAHDQRNADMKVARRKWDAARKRADAALDRATSEADARWLAARDKALLGYAATIAERTNDEPVGR